MDDQSGRILFSRVVRKGIRELDDETRTGGKLGERRGKKRFREGGKGKESRCLQERNGLCGQSGTDSALFLLAGGDERYTKATIHEIGEYALEEIGERGGYSRTTQKEVTREWKYGETKIQASSQDQSNARREIKTRRGKGKIQGKKRLRNGNCWGVVRGGKGATDPLTRL